MNIDEAISKAKELIYDEQGDFVSYIDLSNDVFDEITTYEQAIETIINEYNNLKQIEEAHRIENGKLREENKILEDGDMTQMYVNGYYDGEDKWKGKIREKAKWLDNQQKQWLEDRELKDSDAEIIYARNTLEELLKEE